MAETTPPPSGPLAGASGRELRALQQFLLYLGSALTAGEAVNEIEVHLGRVAAAYGAPHARVSVLPTYLVLALEPGRPATLGWLWLVLYVAWIGQYLGEVAFGGYLSGFVGAIVMTPVAYLVERRPSGPPALVSFRPSGCWSRCAWPHRGDRVSRSGPLAGVQDFLGAVGSMVAIGLGVLCGYPLYRSLARTLGWLQELGSG